MGVFDAWFVNSNRARAYNACQLPFYQSRVPQGLLHPRSLSLRALGTMGAVEMVVH